MKVHISFLGSLIFIASSVSAASGIDRDIDIENLGPQQIKEEEAGGPVGIELSGDWIGRAKVRCPGCNHLTFITGEADLNLVYYYDPCLQEGATVGVSYIRTYFNWKNNPYFSQRNYNTVTVNLGLFSQRVPCWTWRAQVAANFGNIDHWNFDDYMSYDMLLWGRYDYCKNLGVHIGFIALTGMKIDRVYPIFGVDWKHGEKWKFNLVFPIDLSIEYSMTSTWSVALAARFLNQRNRAGSDEFLPKGLWFYTTGGIELALNYSPTKWIHANIHAGGNLGGHLKIANRHYMHGRRLRVESAPYAGAEIDINF